MNSWTKECLRQPVVKVRCKCGTNIPQDSGLAYKHKRRMPLTNASAIFAGIRESRKLLNLE
jgi:hypothetical protein